MTSIKSIKQSDINFYDIENMIIKNDKFWEEILEEWCSEGDKKEFNIRKENTKKNTIEIHKLFQKKENCIFLTWAGISVTSWWPLMWELWLYFTWYYELDDNSKEKTKNFFIKNVEKYNKYLEESRHKLFIKYMTILNHKDDNYNLEEFLSKLLIYINNFININNIEEDDKKEELEKIIAFKDSIENELKELCDIKYNENSEFSYFLHYLHKIRWDSNKSRLKIFTLNYDTLFEQTASNDLYTVIDGFSFSNPRKFNSSNFDLDIIEKYDNRVENNKLHWKVFHLYKLHGSLNWKKDSNQEFIIWNVWEKNIWEIIYPWKWKYEQSYNMPYFEMLTRFQFELRKKDSVLNIIWYWFWDEHIDRMIIEALKNNNWLTINIFSWSICKKAW